MNKFAKKKTKQKSKIQSDINDFIRTLEYLEQVLGFPYIMVNTRETLHVHFMHV